MNREYASKTGTAWVILSAKYGFLRPTDIIPGPYNVSFKRRATNPIDSFTLRHQVHELSLDGYDEVVGLGGKEYRAAVDLAFKGTAATVRFPFAGLRMGEAMQAVKRASG